MCGISLVAIVVGRYRGEGLRGGVEAEGRTDPATGQPIRPCLVRLLLDREVFESVALDEPRLDPVQCLEHLKARLSENAEAGRITLIDGAACAP